MKHRIIRSTCIESPFSHVKNKATNTDFRIFVRITSFDQKIVG